MVFNFNNTYLAKLQEQLLFVLREEKLGGVLVDTPGVEFKFSDRETSLTVLEKTINERLAAFLLNKTDRHLHPIAVLAAGILFSI